MGRKKAKMNGHKNGNGRLRDHTLESNTLLCPPLLAMMRKKEKSAVSPWKKPKHVADGAD